MCGDSPRQVLKGLSIRGQAGSAGTRFGTLFVSGSLCVCVCALVFLECAPQIGYSQKDELPGSCISVSVVKHVCVLYPFRGWAFMGSPSNHPHLVVQLHVVA